MGVLTNYGQKVIMDGAQLVSIEERLLYLDRQLELTQRALDDAEYTYYQTKSSYELAMAKSRLRIRVENPRITVADKDDQALVDNETLALELALAEAAVRAARANVGKLRSQVDIARSLSAVTRATMELT